MVDTPAPLAPDSGGVVVPPTAAITVAATASDSDSSPAPVVASGAPFSTDPTSGASPESPALVLSNLESISTPQDAQSAIEAAAAAVSGEPSSPTTPGLTSSPLYTPPPAATEATSSGADPVLVSPMSPTSDQSAPEPVVASPSVPDAAPGTTPLSPMSMTQSIAAILVRMGELKQNQLDQLEVERIQTNRPLDELLEEKKWVDEEPFSRAKAEFVGVPFVRLADIGISPEALTALSETVARRYGMLPFSLDKKERTLSVAMKNPLDLSAIDFAEQKTGYRLIVHYAMPSELDRLVAERYAQSLSTEVTQALQETAQVADARAQQQNLANLSSEVVRQAPITKIVETILTFAIKSRASDVHIEPLADKTRVRYRIDGILMEKLILPKSVHEATVSRVKILSDLKIDEKRVPQDGRFNFVAGADEVDLRVSTLPTIHGEKIVMRLLRKNANVPSLEQLGLTGLALKNIQESIKVPHGIILVTGPTGSGKTTTLYSVLHTVNTPKVNVMTLEDPVEYQMAGINQVQINPQAGLSFASGLRSFLRQDPNIIMVGEIRDSETAELAIQASLTGHLVFSTLHTSSAAGALPRLLDMGAEPFLLASSMTLTMGQRVVRLINPDFKEEYQPDPAVLADIRAVLGPLYEQWCTTNNKDPNKLTLYRTTQNRPQTEPEYKGRMAIFEVMRITDEIGHLVMQRKAATEIEKVAMKDGMLLMKQDGYIKALEGKTTIEEVLRVAQV